MGQPTGIEASLQWSAVARGLPHEIDALAGALSNPMPYSGRLHAAKDWGNDTKSISCTSSRALNRIVPPRVLSGTWILEVSRRATSWSLVRLR